MVRQFALRAALLGGLLGACDDASQQAPTPPPLAPRDYEGAQRELEKVEQVFDDKGNLLPSETFVAGIRLPRGMHPEYTFEHEWYLRSRASLDQLRAYFGPRLLTGKVERSGMGTVTYVEAQPKDQTERRYVSVRIGPAPGNRKESEVFISETPMMPVSRPSESESRKLIEAQMRYAD